MKKNQTKTSKPAAATTPKQKPRTLNDATSPSATINDLKKTLAQIRQILTSDIAAYREKQDECIDVINKHHRDIGNLKEQITDIKSQIWSLKFSLFLAFLFLGIVLICSFVALGRINYLKNSMHQSSTYDTTSPFNSTAN